ncbi:two-component regulator propeller domain-containing protein [Dyadobacter sp. LHD-138]|uniref:hybrid sensor histidine kinase/response regulator transcription factor n=1 Tax=Dyadobacter sp. LHD-138 TaxID=3071413 RepID=UPI0027DFCF30|nr:two-component regulator propeller domain-containing protein [Dyadobacter sp. LHD-138]MDQ6476864.1 two-component regulator propeller domain-containing protein [Dyadobacter sp. LHD-138]
MSAPPSHLPDHTCTRILVLLIAFLSLSRMGFAWQSEHRFKQLGIDHGLSQNMVNTIFQDHRGYMWFGTKDGLNRYDGYSFKIYKTNPHDPTAISDNYITCIYEDDLKNLWVGTMFGGLNLYEEETDVFVKIDPGSRAPGNTFVSSITGNSKLGLWVSFLNGDIVGFQPGHVNDKTKLSIQRFVTDKEELLPIPRHILLAGNGLLWINSNRGIIQYDIIKKRKDESLRDYPTYVVSYRNGKPGTKVRNDDFSPFKNDIGEISQDDKGGIWMTSSLGLYQFNISQKTFILYQLAPNATAVLPVVNRHNEREIWVSTHNNGLAIFRVQDKSVQFYPYKGINGLGMPDGRIISMRSGRDGTVWMGSSGLGIISYSPNLSLFQNGILAHPNHESLPSKSVYALYADIGSPGTAGSLMLSTFSFFAHMNLPVAGPSFPAVNYELTVRCIAKDQQGYIWMGGMYGLLRFDPHTGKRELFANASRNVIMSISIDKHQNIWYSTSFALVCLNPVSRVQRKYVFLSEIDSRAQDILYSTIHPDEDQTLWVGTTNGLFHFDPKQEKFISVFRNNPADKRTLGSNEIKCILSDPVTPDKVLWIGTPVGLNRFDKQTKSFTHFTTKDGLPNNTVYGILPDQAGNLWLSTNKGLSKFNPVTREFINFDIGNRLQSNEFNTGAYFKSDDGELFFGGINGYNRFYPENIRIPQNNIPIVVSDIRLLGEQEGKFSDLSPSRVNALPHHANNISITLASLDYTASTKIRYAYRIANEDTAWIQLGNNRNVTLTNLSPGKYIFQAKGTDSFGRWSTQSAEVVFEISPPWWNSLLARICYVMIFLGSMAYLWSRYRNRIILKHQMENERRQAATVMELDKMKSHFLANITHEFRTPLTLINGHLELLRASEMSDQSQHRYKEIEHNSAHLLRLINQLMDLSKLESGKYELQPSSHLIVNDVKAIVLAFHSYAERKKLELSLKIAPETADYLADNPLVYDSQALTTILNNLLSNACKFTDEKGGIAIELDYDRDGKQIQIQISDTGPGIPEEDIPKIFDRFFQSNHTLHRSSEGSGIGLSLVKELALLHGGSAEAIHGAGATFRIILKAGRSEGGIVNTIILGNEKRVSDDPIRKIDQSGDELPLILIVEDHPELRKFIRECLGNTYQYAEAFNGSEGIKMASELIPDLILSDLMMPQMDGLQLCRLLKTTEATSHIPVVMLTAKADLHDRLIGLETGADDYIAKPFSARELQIRVHNLIDNRKLLHERYSRRDLADPEEMSIQPMERVFIQKAIEVIDENLTNSQFGVEVLAGSLHLSPSQLNRKLKALTGQSALVLMRDYRMQKALELLRCEADTISEVAFRVGFEDPGYFTKVFKKHFGFLPSEKDRILTYKV